MLFIDMNVCTLCLCSYGQYTCDLKYTLSPKRISNSGEKVIKS